MKLNQFRDVDVVLDKANDNIIQKQFVSAGDKDGRSLTVQLTDNGVIGEIIGAAMNLYWHNQASGLTDLSAFYVVDRATSVFKIDYPQNMLTPGKVIAYIQILHGGKVTHTKPFEITVQKLAGTTRGVLATAEYSALVTTLAKANEFETDIAVLDNGKMDKNTNNISVAQINKNLGKLDQTYLTDELLQQIAGNTPINSSVAPRSITTDKLDYKSVSPKNTTFAYPRKNLFDGTYHKIGLGGPNANLIVNTDGNLSAIARVEPNKKYTIWTDVNTLKYIGAFNQYPNVGNVSGTRAGGLTTDRVSITTGNDEYYLVANISKNSTYPNKLQIEEGEFTEYEAPNTNIVIDLADESIPDIDITKTKFYKRSRNMFDGTYQRNTIVRNEGVMTHGTTAGLTDARTTNAIECEPNKTYVMSSEYDRTRWRFEDIDNNFISVVIGTVAVAPDNAHHMYVYYSTDGTHEKLQIEEGEDPTPYSAPYVIDKDYLPATTAVATHHGITLLGDDGSDYEVSGNYVQPFAEKKADLIYGAYDDLMTMYPNYIAKTQLGASALGVPIYLYEFKTPTTKILKSHKVKVYLNGGTHGIERSAIYGTLRFLTDLCNDWRNQKSLQFIRTNVHLIFVPLLSPDGFELGTRKNGNEVDLNRNFPADWVYNPNTESHNYTGETPASEIETQIMMQLLEDHPDIYFAVDYHNYTTLQMSGDMTWVGADDTITQKVIKAWGQAYDSDIKRKFSIVEDYEESLVSVRDKSTLGTYNGGTGRYMESLGLHAVTLEAVEGFGTTQEEVQKFNADLIGNFILNMVRSYRDLS